MGSRSIGADCTVEVGGDWQRSEPVPNWSALCREGGWKTQGRTLGLFLLQWLLNASFPRGRKVAGVLLVPYLAWVSAMLNFTIWRLNA